MLPVLLFQSPTLLYLLRCREAPPLQVFAVVNGRPSYTSLITPEPNQPHHRDPHIVLVPVLTFPRRCRRRSTAVPRKADAMRCVLPELAFVR